MLTPAALALRTALAGGRRLAVAAAAALTAEPDVDLPALLREAVDEGCLTA